MHTRIRDLVEPFDLTVDVAADAARIEVELHGDGRPIGAMDTLIAGVVRESGGTLVTADSHFEDVRDFDVHCTGENDSDRRRGRRAVPTARLSRREQSRVTDGGRYLEVTFDSISSPDRTSLSSDSL